LRVNWGGCDSFYREKILVSRISGSAKLCNFDC
jgi:hypothetical protein